MGNSLVLLAEYPGWNGFLGTRADFMVDFVVVAMVGILPILGWSIWLAKYGRNYVLHKRLQIVLAAVLGVAVLAFEVDIRLFGWRERAQGSAEAIAEGVLASLYIHLVFAISTLVLWVYVLVHALRNIPDPPKPCPQSAHHRFWARIAAIDMVCTAVTGWIFYYLAFT